MKSKVLFAVLLLVCMCATFLRVAAQESATAPAVAAGSNMVPNLVNFSGVLKDGNGRTLTGLTGVTFLLYREEQGGAPLWLETQNVMPDRTGHYTVHLGAASGKGLPSYLFVNGEARWLAVQVGNEPEQSRVLLVAVPYAMKAADAQTVGGLPASAFVLATPGTGIGAESVNNAASLSSSPSALPVGSALTGGGTANTISMFTGASTIGNSIMTQTGTSAINIRGKLNLPATGTANATKGFNSQPQSYAASVFNSGTSLPVTQTFQWQAEPVNNDKTTASGTFNLLYAAGTAVPAETGLRINSKGQLTFAAGQTFPGAGTITGVKAGTDLTGGGSAGIVTLNLDTTKVPQLATANTFTASQKVNGTVTATSFSGNGASVTSVNAAKLGGLLPAAFAKLAANNTFSGTNTFNGMEFVNEAVVGPINNFAAGQLAASSPSSSIPGIGAAGFTVATGSGLNGGNGISTFGGSGDPNANTGGTGIVAEGGGGFNGGNGIFGLGGGGGPCCIGSTDGDGGFFEGGSNSLNAGDGVFGMTGSGFAGNFSGDLNVTGQIFAGTKDFRIDHPLDPANKYLTHASVESSEMMNIYTGNVTTDGSGEATVALPEWFEAVNTDFRYQLTVIGQFAQAIIGQKIAHHQFTIRTSAPNVEVSWQVTAVRHDAFAKAHPLVVEAEKEARMKGFYIHPELYGAPPEKQMEWARHPQMMKRAKELRTWQLQTAQRTMTESIASPAHQ